MSAPIAMASRALSAAWRIGERQHCKSVGDLAEVVAQIRNELQPVMLVIEASCEQDDAATADALRALSTITALLDAVGGGQ